MTLEELIEEVVKRDGELKLTIETDHKTNIKELRLRFKFDGMREPKCYDLAFCRGQQPTPGYKRWINNMMWELTRWFEDVLEPPVLTGRRR